MNYYLFVCLFNLFNTSTLPPELGYTGQSSLKSHRETCAVLTECHEPKREIYVSQSLTSQVIKLGKHTKVNI